MRPLPPAQEERLDSLLFELIAVKFDLADRTHELEKAKRAARGLGTDGVYEEKERAGNTPTSDKDSDNDLHSREMLYLAAEEGLDEIVKGILNPKPSRQSVLGDVFGHALRRAARGGHAHIVKRLMDVDAHLSVRSTEEDCLHQTCLHAAATGGHEAIVRLILTHAKEKQVCGFVGVCVYVASRGAREE